MLYTCKIMIVILGLQASSLLSRCIPIPELGRGCSVGSFNVIYTVESPIADHNNYIAVIMGKGYCMLDCSRRDTTSAWSHNNITIPVVP